LAGLAAFVACGTLLDVTISGGAATWLASFAIGAGVANLTSFELRRRRVTTRPARASDVSIRSTRKRFAVGAAMLGLLATVAFLGGAAAVGYPLIGAASGCLLLSLTYRRWV
jgi:hypothetical protein